MGCCAAAALAALAGCADRPDQPGGAAAAEVTQVADEVPAPAPVPQLALQAAAATCTGTGAHDAHAPLAGGCATCHPCGGALGLAAGATLPSGRALTGTIARSGGDATCAVACHAPPGGAATSIAWSATGPLACTTCHAQGGAVPAGGSSHPAAGGDPIAVRAACQGCHELSRHVSGKVRIQAGGQVIETGLGGAPELNPVCEACHLGKGQSLAGKSPPLLVGWADPAGDFHGARAGTGSGGTLAAPYVRGQAALACTACHDAHASGNPWLFRAGVNGQALPVGAITRAGVGAEQLCAGCHLGERHGSCLACHQADPQPAGSPCFACHGHEGVRAFPYPVAIPHGAHGPLPGYTADCTHCHDTGWIPALELRAPVLSGLAVSATAPGAATVTWTTDEPASGFVEYGQGSYGLVAGDAALQRAHAVQLTGLTGPATYQLRVASSDRYRNQARSAGATFLTADPEAPGTPVLLRTADAWTWNDAEPMTMAWQASASPLGHAVEYRVVVVLFGTTVADSGWIAGTAWTTSLAAGYYPDSYGWRVMARDRVSGKTSAWSEAGVFGVWWY